ncbi:MAG: hypothetical protein RIC55_31235 [Pirellulaceae bacterium]
MTTASTIGLDWDRTDVRHVAPLLPVNGLSGDLEKAMQRVVRRIIRRGEAQSFVDGQVMAVAESLICRSSTLQTDRDRLVSRVARRLCEMLQAHARQQPRRSQSDAC